MKKLFVSLFLFCAPALAFGANWAFLEDVDEPSPNVSPSANSSGAGSRYLLHRVLAGNPLRVWVTDGDPAAVLHRGEKGDEAKIVKYERLVSENYARWFSEPAKIIRSSGREVEFADVLPVLDRGISVQFVNGKQSPDLIVSALTLEELWELCQGAGCHCGPADSEWGVHQIFLPKPDFWHKYNLKQIGQHETGHSLGLSDQYKEFRSVNSHPLYHTDISQKSVMDTTSPSITCDDADGIINLIDLLRGFSRGGELGWRSLCRKSKTYYVKGKPVPAGPYAVKLRDNGKKWILQISRPGEQIKEAELPLDLQAGLSPFVLLKETVREQDAAGRTVFAQGPDGEEIYYSYVYDKRIRLVTRKGRVLLGEVTTAEWEKGRLRQKTQMNYFGEEGGCSMAGWRKEGRGKNKKGSAFYEKHDSSGSITESRYVDFNRNGSVSDPLNSEAFSRVAGGNWMDQFAKAKQQEEALREWYLRQ